MIQSTTSLETNKNDLNGLEERNFIQNQQANLSRIHKQSFI